MAEIYSTEEFEEKYTYTGDDLGFSWSPERTVFRVWAPMAQAVAVKLYKSGDPDADDMTERLSMAPDVKGTWTAEKEGDLEGVYYTYEATADGKTAEACDPYARAAGVNGRRAMVIDLRSTDPEGWAEDANPNAGLTYNDAVIYELHVRDLSSDPGSGIKNAGKFLGLTETGTKTPGGALTGIDHIRELGVTHVHLLPVFDFGSVDEAMQDRPQYNWGYDPVNYNVPEGSYSTDPYDGHARVREMKQMVHALHLNGLSVIMDVVYNHVFNAREFCFNKLVPGYFSRISEDGAYSNGSGCGNDTASERSMVRKYIVDSVKYWADEYHIDGFRFDLAGLLDVQTVNMAVERVHQSRPDVIFYGEGWAMGTDATKQGVVMATQANSALTPGFAYFNDTIRNAITGGVFGTGPGYASGDLGRTADIRQCFTGLNSWCAAPAQAVNYASCHDNYTLIDRLAVSRPGAGREELIRMNKLAAAIYITSQGIPFMQAGEEMLRSKVNTDGSFNPNSYNAPDAVNAIRWSDLDDPAVDAVFKYYKGLIAFRRAHPALRLADGGDAAASIRAAEEGLAPGVVAFEIEGGVNGEPSDGLYVIFNPTGEAQNVPLPSGCGWDVYIDGERAGTEALGTFSGTATVAPVSAMTLVKRSGAPEAGPASKRRQIRDFLRGRGKNPV